MQVLPPDPPEDLPLRPRSARSSPGRGGRIWLLRPLSQGGPPGTDAFQEEGSGELSARRCACAAGYAGLALTELRYSQAARAVELANAIGSVTGARLHIDEDLRARSFGDWESLSRGAMRSAWDAQAESYWAHPAHWKPPGGESHAQLEERALRAFERCQPNAGETALIICHGEVMRAITAAVLGMPLERLAVLGTPPGLGILLRDHAKGWSLERTGARPDEKRASDLVP